MCGQESELFLSYARVCVCLKFNHDHESHWKMCAEITEFEAWVEVFFFTSSFIDIWHLTVIVNNNVIIQFTEIHIYASN